MTTQVNATDIAAHCDTMLQKRNLNTILVYLKRNLQLIVNNILYSMLEKNVLLCLVEIVNFSGVLLTLICELLLEIIMSYLDKFKMF